VGLAKNKRLNALSAELQAEAQAQYEASKEKVRLFGAFQYKAASWDRKRRVIAKAEHNAHGPNPRYLGH
jgi:DDE family transposase